MNRPGQMILPVVAAAALLAGACTDQSPAPHGVAVPAALTQRVQDLQDAVTAWSHATDLAAARTAAERASNLVTGPSVTGSGDLDRDGTVTGDSTTGLLPGEHGEPGLASGLGSSCLDRDVLGGSWADPARRWADLRERIDRWRPDNNTFPSLPSHPQRVVGWAHLTLRATSLDAAHEYAGHANLHVSVIRDAVASCAAQR